MLFITNRVFKEGNKSPEVDQASGTQPGRAVTFDLDDNNALQSVFFCERTTKGQYTELGSKRFMDALKGSKAEQLLVFIHGFANLPEDAVFERAETLQRLFNERSKNLVEVVTILWPCRSSEFNATFEAAPRVVGNYFTDQHAADACGHAFARVLQRLLDWQAENIKVDDKACIKKINVLAHSMGNRVLAETMKTWCYGILRQDPPLIFRNVFLVAADLVNEILEPGQDGELISFASGTVTVYYAADDWALRASKGANVANGIASRRLGHTGPQDLSAVARNVVAVDCGDFNSEYDPFGHTYFLTQNINDDKAKPGVAFEHIASTIEAGRLVRQTELADPRMVQLAKRLVGARRKATKKKP